MPIVSVKGFFDTHVHTGPAPFRRLGDTIEIARLCAKEGMAGIVVKSHFEATISKCYHARKEVPDLKIIPSITLNRGVGGMNPAAVEQSLSQGAKVIWLPTIDAANHISYFGAGGSFGNVAEGSYQSMKTRKARGNYTVLKNGKLLEEIKEIVDLSIAFQAVLATGHINREEIFAIVEYAISKNHNKVVITHPEMYVPNLDIQSQIELSKLGCYMEYCAINCFPVFHCVSLEELKEMIEAVTPSRAILATDSGQPFSPNTPELFRIFVQMLYEKGLDSKSIAQMAIKNPASLLGFSPEADAINFKIDLLDQMES
ncbi:MAG: DUF6282 family protein [Desulfatiglandaceae bacterium]